MSQENVAFKNDAAKICKDLTKASVLVCDGWDDSSPSYQRTQANTASLLLRTGWCRSASLLQLNSTSWQWCVGMFSKCHVARDYRCAARSWLLRLLELRLTNFPTYFLTNFKFRFSFLKKLGFVSEWVWFSLVQKNAVWFGYYSYLLLMK